MVSSITSQPYYSYLNDVLNAGQSAAPSTTQTTSSSTLPADTSASTNNALAQSLLSGGSFEPSILSLLQGPDSNGNFSPLSLLGGTSENNATSTLLSNLYASNTSAALTTAQDNAQATAPATTTGTTSQTSTVKTGADLIDSLISASTQASVAYNNTLIQNAQQALQNNDLGPDGNPLNA